MEPDPDERSPTAEDARVQSNDHKGSRGSGLAAGRRPLLLLTRSGDKVLMGIVLAAAMIGLNHAALHGSRLDQEVEADNYPGAGIIVRCEVIHLLLDETLGPKAERPHALALPRGRQGSKSARLPVKRIRNLGYLSVSGHD